LPALPQDLFPQHLVNRNNELFAGGFDVRDMTFRHGPNRGIERWAIPGRLKQQNQVGEFNEKLGLTLW
jgi:hypothetical protein